MTEPTRPALRYHGGKWKLAPWIISHFPPHRVYVEPFGGAASVLLRKPRSYAEIYNDLNDDLVAFFRVLRDREQSARLIELLRLTPFARVEFDSAHSPTNDPVECARRLLVRAFMGFGSASVICSHKTGFRANSNRRGTTPAHGWANYQECMHALVDRMKGVIIEHRDAVACMQQHDSLETLHYVDPPYVHSTREFKRTRAKTVYSNELTDADHCALADNLKKLSGMVFLSGYRCELYDSLYAEWERREKKTFADGARPRIECLWLNSSAAAQQVQMRFV